MTYTLESPERRDGFDTGSVSELAQDCRDLHLPEFTPRPWNPHHVEIDVPSDAAALLADLDDYGS